MPVSIRCCCLLLPLLLAVGGCSTTASRNRDAQATAAAPPPTTFDTNAPAATAPQDADIHQELAQLARGKDAKDDEGQAAHDEAVAKLTAHGPSVEPHIIDALRTDADWNVRLGCIEVLQSIGSKTCIDHLIYALTDREPLVALQANYTLEALTKHQEIPAAGAPTGANGLPPVPRRRENENEMDVELRLWTSWYHDHGPSLHQAWVTWWKANREHVAID